MFTGYSPRQGFEQMKRRAEEALETLRNEMAAEGCSERKIGATLDQFVAAMVAARFEQHHDDRIARFEANELARGNDGELEEP